MRRPAPARLPSAIEVSVDLPMPGEPPSSTSEPGTRPPPSTRSSSPIPVCRRGTAAPRRRRAVTGLTAAGGRAAARRRGRPADAAGRDFLDERVPLAAARALAVPLGGTRAAGGADEDGRGAGHRRPPGGGFSARVQRGLWSPPDSVGPNGRLRPEAASCRAWRQPRPRAPGPAPPARPSRSASAMTIASASRSRTSASSPRIAAREQHLRPRQLGPREERPRAHPDVHLARLDEAPLGLVPLAEHARQHPEQARGAAVAARRPAHDHVAAAVAPAAREAPAPAPRRRARATPPRAG